MTTDGTPKWRLIVFNAEAAAEIEPNSFDTKSAANKVVKEKVNKPLDSHFIKQHYVSASARGSPCGVMCTSIMYGHHFRSQKGSGRAYLARLTMCIDLLTNIIEMLPGMEGLGMVIVATIGVNKQASQPHHFRTRR